MASLKYAAIGAAFEILSRTGLARLIRSVSASRGVIFTLHRVLPETPAAFAPNSILQVTPDFLEFTIRRVRELGLDIVDLDEAIRRLSAPEPGRRFVVFTFDDAYRDNLEHALPILTRLNCPFTLYVPTALVDGTGEIWWQALEDIISRNSSLSVILDGQSHEFALTGLEARNAAYDTLYWHMRAMPEPARVALIRDLAQRVGYDLAGQCRDLIMTWPELETIAASPLCTIGAHTVHHYELAKLPPAEAREEITASIRILSERLGVAPRHLSYPIGGPASAGEREFTLAAELGLASAVTTRPGGLYPAHMDSLTALPRVSLNGNFQRRHFIDVFATGAVFSTLGRFAG